MAAFEDKYNSEIEQAREQVREADKRVHTIEAELKKHESGQVRIDALDKLYESLELLRQTGGSDPISGEKLGESSYDTILKTISKETSEFHKIVEKLRKDRGKFREEVSKATQRIDTLTEKYDAESKKRRHEALEAYRRQVSKEGFQPREGDVFYRTMALPWGGTGEDDRRLRRVSILVALLALLLSIGMTIFIVPEIEEEEVELPPRLAKLLLEREKKPEPIKKDEPTVEKKELKPRKKAPKPKTEEQRKARKKARQSGLLAFSESFEELKDNSFEDKLGTQSNISTSGRRATKSKRSIVTSAVQSGSGGIQSSRLTRDVGGGGLSGRKTSRVQSSLADQLAASADRRLTSSGKASRTDEEIQIVFDRNKSALYSLYNRELRKDPTLQGKVVLKLTIAPSGAVTKCTVLSSSMKAPALERKIAQRVKLFNFGAKDVNAVTITYPIDFLPA